MYEYIKGILTKITAKYIVVETAGIGYLLHVQSHALLWQNGIKRCKSTSTKWSGKMLTFSMVLQPKKRKALLNLISVSGIGPVSALLSLLQMTMQALSKPSKARTSPT